MTCQSTADHNPWSVFLVFLRLGLTSFGGPVAHLGHFRHEFVTRRQWIAESRYADLVALCQFLPGPASSQVGMALGLTRCGHRGALAAWAGFTLPSALAMTLFALGLAHWGSAWPPGALHGLKVATVAVVAQAVWGMSRQLCPDLPRITIMAVVGMAVLLVPGHWSQLGCMAVAATVGGWAFCRQNTARMTPAAPSFNRRLPWLWLGLFVGLLLGLPLLAKLVPTPALSMADAFYRAGSLVFGGGHVVLPMLQTEVVQTGWVSREAFLAGYGAAQAVPGPLFTFAAFLGASANGQLTGWTGALVALIAVFAPSFLLVAGALPFWDRLRHHARARGALTGINAAVVGLLLAALYDPVWTSTIHTPYDLGLALLALVALMHWKLPPWLLVLVCGLLGLWLPV